MNQNSWHIIKEHFIKNSLPKSFGYSIELNKAADLFVKVMRNLKDEKDATNSFNADKEVLDALLQRKNIDELRKAGVLSE